MPDVSRSLLWASLVFPVYYVLLSLRLDFGRGVAPRQERMDRVRSFAGHESQRQSILVLSVTLSLWPVA